MNKPFGMSTKKKERKIILCAGGIVFPSYFFFFKLVNYDLHEPAGHMGAWDRAGGMDVG